MIITRETIINAIRVMVPTMEFKRLKDGQLTLIYDGDAINNFFFNDEITAIKAGILSLHTFGKMLDDALALAKNRGFKP